MWLKSVFSHLMGLGFIMPMYDTNDEREMFYLYVVNHEKEKLFVFEHCYEEEILEYIESGTFEYDKCLRFNEEEEAFYHDCKSTALNELERE